MLHPATRAVQPRHLGRLDRQPHGVVALQTCFAAGTLALLGYGHYLVYVKPRQVCADGSCVRQLPNQLIKVSLWIATVLVVAALAFDYIAPLLPS
jgi:hypothetical protein